ILVNNAGKGAALLETSPQTKSLKFWEADPDTWREIIVTNVNGTFLMARSAAPVMVEAGWGRIVNITTSLATMQRRHNSPYGVSKAAIEAETLIWAKDLDGTGVTVNSLIPGGAADTEFVHMASRKELAALGRALLPPSVMVAPIVWLASPLSDGVTGARFVAKLWDDRLPPNEAAAKAREASVLLALPPDGRGHVYVCCLPLHQCQRLSPERVRILRSFPRKREPSHSKGRARGTGSLGHAHISRANARSLFALRRAVPQRPLPRLRGMDREGA